MTGFDLAAVQPFRGRVEPRRLGPVGISVAVGACGVIATAWTVWTLRSSPVLVDARQVSIIRGLFVASYVVVGLYTWRRRPGNRLGALFVGAGLLWALVSLNGSGERLPYTIGRLLLGVFAVYLVYVAVAFPGDRLRVAAERRFLILFSVASATTWVLALALATKLPAAGALSDCANRCPPNALAIVSTSSTVTRVIDFAVTAVTAAGLAWGVLLLVGKIRSPSRLRRRAVAPLLIAFILYALSYVIYSILNQADAVADQDVLRAVAALSSLAVPLALLIGQIRGRAFAVARLGQMASEAGKRAVTPGVVQALIADALGDPTATLALAAADGAGYIDVNGDDLQLPDDRVKRAVIPVARDGQPVAAVIHDPAVDEDLAVVEGLAATSLMLLENRKLLADLDASRARMVAAAGRERMRIERDLHDGAQQQLVALQIRLTLMLDRVDEPGLASELQDAAQSAESALEQLRELAHGIYPSELHYSGPAAALRTAARGLPLPVTVEDHGTARCDRETETAIYFCSLEALQNATKHAGANARITITLDPHPHGIAFAITDDGAGFNLDAHADGIGLLSMRDRLEAIGGHLTITSSPGHGTTVQGKVTMTHGNMPARPDPPQHLG